jgi:probable rRNA maturation factor
MVLERSIAVQYAVPRMGVPAAVSLRRWAQIALGTRPGDVTLRVVGRRESAALNTLYRGRDRATNVLSFPMSPLPDGSRPIRGDLVLCSPVIDREAHDQGKPASAHWAHMVVHGCLHLCGYDHEQEDQTAAMETEECRILAKLGYPDPYRERYVVECS